MGAVASDTGYYLVHSCEVGTSDHEDNCNGVFVWAESADDAVVKAAKKDSYYLESGRAERYEQIDKHHGEFGDLIGNGWGPKGPAVDRLWRNAGFYECGGGISCEECDLYEWASLPESQLCQECCVCVECGCECEARCCALEGCYHEGPATPGSMCCADRGYPHDCGPKSGGA